MMLRLDGGRLLLMRQCRLRCTGALIDGGAWGGNVTAHSRLQSLNVPPLVGGSLFLHSLPHQLVYLLFSEVVRLWLSGRR